MSELVNLVLKLFGRTVLKSNSPLSVVGELEEIEEKPTRSCISGKEYYDLNHLVEDLKREDEETKTLPYMVTHGELFNQSYLFPNKSFSIQNFAHLTRTFFKYYVGASYFEPKEIEEINIPKLYSLEHTLQGDIYLRRFSPTSFLYELADCGFFEKLTHDFYSVLDFCQNNDWLPNSVANVLKIEYKKFKKEEKIMEKLNSSSTQLFDGQDPT